ncbi:MAG: PKD domain-containing protein [Planctomycetota bacterium]|nr:PKD domain-containing protein [Planctomycetota bacterium]
MRKFIWLFIVFLAALGCSSKSKSDGGSGRGGDPEITVAFSGSPTSGAAPLTVNFTDSSTSTAGTINSWQWDFNNDGTVDSTSQNPSYQYTTAGTYSVKLTVGDTAGKSGYLLKSNYITVTAGGGSGDGTGGKGGPTGSGTATIPNTSNRSFAYYIPSGYNESTPTPVLYTMHGSGGTATSMRDVWVSTAEANKFLVFALQSDGAGWDFSNDMDAFFKMIDYTDSLYNIHKKKRYLHGYSAGAHWTYAVGLYYNKFFAALAVFAGSMNHAISMGIWPLDYAGGDRKIPVCIHHGDADTVVPVSHARDAKAKLEGAGHPVFYREIPGGTHAYDYSYNPEVWNFIKNYSAP